MGLIVLFKYIITFHYLFTLVSTSSIFLYQGGMHTLMSTVHRFQDEHRLVVVAFMTLENLLKTGLYQ